MEIVYTKREPRETRVGGEALRPRAIARRLSLIHKSEERPVRDALNRWLSGPAAKPAALIAMMAPGLWLIAMAFADKLGANPAEALIRGSGDWAIRMLCVALAITPIRKIAGLPALARLRRLAGLAAYGWVMAHLLCYAWLDMGFEMEELLKDVGKRPFIMAGMGAMAILTMMALTSWDGAIRRLGAKNWRRLHKAVHAVAALALLHFFWMRAGKHHFGDVMVYAGIIAALLGYRAREAWKDARGKVRRSERSD